MLEVLDWVYGPGGQNDPYYLLLRDFILLMPWWYPWFWVAIISGVIGMRHFARWRRRAHSIYGLRRVKARTDKILGAQFAELSAQRIRRRPANDFASADRPTAA